MTTDTAPRTYPNRTAEVLTAMTAVQQTVNEHDLPAGSVDIRGAYPGMKHWDPAVEWDGSIDGWTLPDQPTVHIRLYGDPIGFYRWCEALNVDRIQVERRDFDTLLNAEVRKDGITWQIAGDANRPAKPNPHLPGIPAPWKRDNGRLTNYGRISRDDLRTTLTALGVL
jgi:hypothetical protein